VTFIILINILLPLTKRICIDTVRLI